MTNAKKIWGWVSLYRSLAHSDLWLSEKFTRGQAWVDMLMNANHTNGYIRVRGNRVHLARGQLGWSQKTLAERWGWSRGKVIRFFNELEGDGMIVQQKNTVTSIITVTNYSEYQKNEQQTEQQKGTRKTANGHQTSTNNNVNKKNKANNDNKGGFSPPSLEDLTLFFIEKSSTCAEAKKFMNYYKANGWKVGNNAMHNWKAASEKWIDSSYEFTQAKTTKKQTYINHESDF